MGLDFENLYGSNIFGHTASEAISLVSNPLISNVLIKRCCAASRCGAMIVAAMNQLTLAGWEQEGEEEGRATREPITAGSCSGYLEYNQPSVHSHRPHEMAAT
jgi:hypothetical protein